MAANSRKGPAATNTIGLCIPGIPDDSQAPSSYQGGDWVDIPRGDAINQWHIHGCKVAPGFIRFYIDGQEVGRIPTKLDYLDDPLYIIINYALR